MIKPIFKIINNKLDIIGFHIYINIYLHTPPTLFEKIKKNTKLPMELNRMIISYLPDNFILKLRVDIPNTFPLNTIYVSFSSLENTYLFPNYNFKEEIFYIKEKVKKYNYTYCMVDNRNNIDFEYLKLYSIEYLNNEIYKVIEKFSRIQCVYL